MKSQCSQSARSPCFLFPFLPPLPHKHFLKLFWWVQREPSGWLGGDWETKKLNCSSDKAKFRYFCVTYQVSTPPIKQLHYRQVLGSCLVPQIKIQPHYNPVRTHQKGPDLLALHSYFPNAWWHLRHFCWFVFFSWVTKIKARPDCASYWCGCVSVSVGLSMIGLDFCSLLP